MGKYSCPCVALHERHGQEYLPMPPRSHQTAFETAALDSQRARQFGNFSHRVVINTWYVCPGGPVVARYYPPLQCREAGRGKGFDPGITVVVIRRPRGCRMGRELGGAGVVVATAETCPDVAETCKSSTPRRRGNPD